jgi:hypothetical protein
MKPNPHDMLSGSFGSYGTDTPREPVIKAAQMITDRMGHKVNGHDPDYYGLAGMITDEMAEIARKNGSPQAENSF